MVYPQVDVRLSVAMNHEQFIRTVACSDGRLAVYGPL
jgi:hypothetical protein